MSIERKIRRRDGRVVYEVRLRSPDGREYSRTFLTRREAKGFAAKERTERSRGGWIDPRRAETRVGDLAAWWLASNPAKRSGSVARDETILRRHLLPMFADRPVGAITRKEVQDLVNSWVGHQAPRTVRRQYGTLRAVLNAAVELDLIARSPCRHVNLPAVPHVDRPLLTPEQLRALAEAIGPEYAGMVYLGATLGLRWGECAGLRVARLDFLRNTLTVAEQLTRGAHGVPVLGPPKSEAGRRTLAVPAPVMAHVSAHMARRGITGADGDAFVFTSPDGGLIDYSHWRSRNWIPACRAAGVSGLRFHDLRHLNATALVAEGVDVKTAQNRLFRCRSAMSSMTFSSRRRSLCQIPTR